MKKINTSIKNYESGESNDYKYHYKFNKYNLKNSQKNNTNTNIKNEKIKDNINENMNEIISTDKKQNKGIISKYFNFTYYQTEKKNSDKKINLTKKFNNIMPNKLDSINQNNLNKMKNEAVSLEKKENSRIRQSYKRKHDNIENIKLYKIKENSSKKEEKDIFTRHHDKNPKNKNKGQNKTKYNDLIKYKLSVCDSINKRKYIEKMSKGIF